MKREAEKELFFYNKTGQVTLFIIIAIVIVAAGVLVYVFYPQISSTLGVGEQDPNSFIQNCVEDTIEDTVELVSMQGGSFEPENFFTYNDVKIEYLCYTEENYKTCVIQQPLLRQHVESEIKTEIEPTVRNCFNELKSSFEDRGYDVTMREGDVNVKLLPERIISTFNYTVTLTRTETQRYESFSVVLNNNLYELINIANSILEWEATYGDADPRGYMTYYPNLKVDKNLRDDGTRIYTLSNRDSGDKFQFSTKSVVFPPGY